MTELRRLGATDLKTAPLVLGSNVFGWTADRQASFAVLDAFVDGGGTLIDTADVYSNWVDGHRGGESETMIGEWLKASGKRDQILLVSKVGWAPERGGELDPDHIAEACDASLQRLGVDYIDLYFAHQDDEKVSQEAVAEALAKLVAAGKVRVLGASNFHAGRLKSAIDGQRAAGLPHYQVLEPKYNLISRAGFEGELQDYCIEHNLGVITYASLASGFLTGKYRSSDDLGKSARVKQNHIDAMLDDQGLAVLDAMDGIADETGAVPSQIALAWLMAQPGVTASIASATSVDQLQELLGAMTLTLTADQLDRLSAAGA